MIGWILLGEEECWSDGPHLPEASVLLKFGCRLVEARVLARPDGKDVGRGGEEGIQEQRRVTSR